MGTEKLYDKIESYLNDSLSDADKKAFEMEMQSNVKLQQEVKLHKDLSRLLADSPEKAFNHNLKVLGERLTDSSPKKDWLGWLKYLLPLLLIGFATILWFGQSNIETTPPKEETNQIQIIPEKAQETKPDLENLNSVEKKEPKEETKTTFPPSKTSKPPIYADDTPSPNQLIAEADFTPNRSLELLIENSLRGDEVIFEIKAKQENTILNSSNTATDFKVTGTFVSKNNLLQSDLRFHLFSNKKEDYQKFLPILSDKLKLQKSSDTNYELDIQKAIVLKSGLYYYLIEDAETEEIFFVEKFEVR